MENGQLKAFVERIEPLEEAVRAKARLQLSLLEKIGHLNWPHGIQGKDGRRLPNPMPRFISFIEPDDEEGCWVWRGTRQSNGYASFPFAGRRWLAHRWIYELTKGPIPSGLVIDHKCHNKACVNIAHLQAITQSANVRRSLGRPTDLPSFLPSKGNLP